MTVGLIAAASDAAQLAFVSDFMGGGLCATSAADARTGLGRLAEFTGFGGFTDDCFDITMGTGKTTAEVDAQVKLGKVYAKVQTASSLVSSLDLFSDAACATKLNRTSGLTAANIANGYNYTTPMGCGDTLAPGIKVPQPFSNFAGGVLGVTLTTPRAVLVQTIYTAAGCATMAPAPNFGTGQVQAVPFGVGGCYTSTLGPATTKYRKMTVGGSGLVQELFDSDSGEEYKPGYSNSFRPLKMTAAQCGNVTAGVVTPISGAYNATTMECACQDAAFTTTLADKDACRNYGGECHVKDTGAASSGAQPGVCGVSISKVDTTGGSVAGTAVGQCGNIANARVAAAGQGAAAIPTVAGTFAGGVCTCTSHAQCAPNKWCFTEYGQQGSPTDPGKCGTLTGTLGAADGMCHPMYKLASDAAPVALGACENSTSLFSIWSVASANAIATSGAVVALAMATLFA